jgi:hypothetical protein
VSGEPIETEAATQGTLICTAQTGRSHPPAANVEYLLDPVAADRCRPPARRSSPSSIMMPICPPHTDTTRASAQRRKPRHCLPSHNTLALVAASQPASQSCSHVDGTPRSNMQSRPLEPLSCMARSSAAPPKAAVALFWSQRADCTGWCSVSSSWRHGAGRFADVGTRTWDGAREAPRALR